MTGISKIISSCGIKMEIIPFSAFSGESDVYTVVLKRRGSKLVVPQSDKKRIPPSVSRVIQDLVEESALCSRAGSFEAWCTQLGLSTEDTLAQREYQQAFWYAEGLRKFLGDAVYNKAMNAWEKSHNKKYTIKSS